MTDYIKGSIWGLIVGDALGVPVEFKEREKSSEVSMTSELFLFSELEEIYNLWHI